MCEDPLFGRSAAPCRVLLFDGRRETGGLKTTLAVAYQFQTLVVEFDARVYRTRLIKKRLKVFVARGMVKPLPAQAQLQFNYIPKTVNIPERATTETTTIKTARTLIAKPRRIVVSRANE